MLGLLIKGGPLMVPILLGSVAALAVLIERLNALARSRVLPRTLGPRVRAAIASGDREEAFRICKETGGAGASVLSAAIQSSERGYAFVKERAEDVGRRQVAELERYVGVLGVIAAVSPLLGLLGTVTGMISVFRQVVTEGVGDPTVLAQGIWEALITTAAGLTVAIPTYLAWRFLLARVRDLSLDLEEESTLLVDQLFPERGGEGPGSIVPDQDEGARP